MKAGVRGKEDVRKIGRDGRRIGMREGTKM